MDPEAVKLYQNLSEISKDIVETYFQLGKPLYFDFTHLVCRTARNGEERIERTNFIHILPNPLPEGVLK